MNRICAKNCGASFSLRGASAPLGLNTKSGAEAPRKLKLAPPYAILCCALTLVLAGCDAKAKVDPKLEAPPPAALERAPGSNFVKVDHPEQFPLATATAYNAAPELNATGVVSPDVSRTIPVISLASGRIIEVHARLGDTVTKGQLLMKVQSADISSAYSDYQQAIADEVLARSQYERAKLLYDKGAIAQKDVEVAQDADAKAKVTVNTTKQRLNILGADPDHPSPVIEVRAPVSGVITDQQVTAAAGTQGLASPNPFTISALSTVWILCDVYENDLSQIHMGEYVDVHLNAYPNQVFKGRIGNISPVLDPNLRTAKVRLEMRNPGQMRIGMFVTAAFHGQKGATHAMVPATAVLHLHDRDFVYVPNEGGGFRRVEVTGGKMLQGNMQEIGSGLEPGTKVVSNALVLQNTVEQ
jgi:membrane fusion protein, heavy metal efflux system